MEKLKICLIDDEENVLQALKRTLRKENFELQASTKAQDIYEWVKKGDIALVISDQRMPEVEGVQVLKKVKELSPKTLTMMLTGYADMGAAIRAVNDGNVYRFFSKPWNDDELKAGIAQALSHFSLIRENERLTALTFKQNIELKGFNDSLEKKVEERTREVLQLNKKLEKSFFETVKVIGDIAGIENVQLGGHGRRVAKLSGLMARAMKLDSKSIFQIQVASYLHDIGKIGLSNYDNLPAEVKKKHPDRGADLLALVSGLENASRAVRSHHEHWDGSGYPNRLNGEEIPLEGRVIFCADLFDKILNTSKGYQSQSPQSVLEEMEARVGKEIDPAVYSVLKNVVETDPNYAGLNLEIEVNLHNLRAGMILARPLLSKQGRTMLAPKVEVTKEILDRLWKRHREDPILSEVYVFKKSIKVA